MTYRKGGNAERIHPIALTDSVRELMESVGKIHQQQETITKMLVKSNGMLIQYINEPTEEMILEAVKQNGMAIQYILPLRQSDEIKMAAIEQNPYCFKYVYQPTVPMWLKAIETEVSDDEELASKHPIKYLKDEYDTSVFGNVKMSKLQKTLLYTTFLDGHPKDLWVIKDDIRGYEDESDLYEFLYTRHADVADGKDIPEDILTDEFIDKVMQKSPCFIVDLNIKYMNMERAKKLIDSNIIYIRTVTSLACDDIIDVNEITKYALDTCDDRLGDITYVLMAYPRNINEIENLSVLLESKNALKALPKIFNRWRLNKEAVEYILNKFKFEDICDNMDDYTLIDHVFSQLSLVESIKYKMRLKKYRKHGRTQEDDVVVSNEEEKEVTDGEE